MIDEREALQALLQLTLIFSAAVIALALLRPLLRRMLGVASPYTAWLLLPAALLALSLPEWPAQAPRASTIILETSQPAPAPTRIEAPEPQVAALGPGLTRGLLLLWGLGLLATTAAFGWQQRRLQRSLLPAAGAWRSPAGSSPALVGCWPARLVLPQDFEQRFSPEEQRLVLAHEAVHAQRLDNHWNLLAAALLALQWFNPLAWWAWRRMRADQEIACDAAVLQRLGADAERARYAQALLKSCHAGPAALLSSRWGPQHPLLERLRLLRHAAPSRLALHLRWPVFAGLGLGAALLVHAATPALPTLPAAPKLDTDGIARAELSTPPDGKSLGLQLELRRPDAPNDHHRLTLGMQRGPLGTYSSTRSQLPQDGWCLDVMSYTYPDGMVRVQAGALDASCRKLLSPPVTLPADGSARELAPPTQQPVLISMRWLEPQSAEMVRLRGQAEIAPSPAKAIEIDQAWQRARGDAPPAPPSPPPAAASAAMPAPPQPPAAPRAQAALPAPPAAHPAGPPAAPPATIAPPPERAAPALPALPAAGASAPIRVELALEFEERRSEHKQTLKTRTTLLLRPGSTGTIRLDVGDRLAPGSEAEQEQLEVSLNLRELEQDQVLIEAQLRLLKSGELIAKPRLITRNGVKARIETGREGLPGQSDRHIRLDVLPTVLAGLASPP